ncbi:MAG TPA: hypothetical protein ENH28_02890 [Euryarchaeota archaeon]|nr:cytochrome c-type biogenesis protein CcmF [archaeon BMS3Bbin15]HDL15091.1 hypothetical protein [Euryarchaeota archaeon]
MIFSVNLGDILLLVTLAIAIFLLFASMMRERGNYLFIKYISLSIRVITVLILGITVYLTYLFVKSDFTNMYVYEYSSRTLPLYYKIAGVWAGQSGTFLLWALLIFIAIFWLNEKFDITNGLVNRTLIVSNFVGIFFLIMTILVSPFRSIYDIYPNLPKTYIPPDGNGLNPLLREPLMAIHPPIIFIGYAAATIPFALAIAYLWKRDNNWIKLAIPWNRFAWLFLTLGIAIGGYWSYKVLGWGGFWQWGPVETASLMPWLIVTAFIHASVRNVRKGEFHVLTIALAAISFCFVVYATFITRSGLWESVHAFGKTTTGPYLAMLLLNAPIVSLILGIDYIKNKGVEASRSAKALVIAFISSQIVVALAMAIVFSSFSLPKLDDIAAIIIITVALFIILRSKFHSSEKKVIDVVEDSDDRLFTVSNLFYSAIILLLILAFISFWGITRPFITQYLTGQKMKVGMDFFNDWSFPFAVLLLSAIVLCMGYGFMKKNDLLVAVGGSGVLGVIAYFVHITPNPFVNFILPFIALSFLVSLYRITVTLLGRGNRKAKIVRASTYMIHAGVALIILGAVVSTTMGTQENIAFKFIPGHGVVKEIKDVGGGYGVSVTNLEVYRNLKGYIVTEIDVSVYKNGKFIGMGAAKSIDNLQYGRVTRVYINKNLDNDVYIIFQGIQYEPGEIVIPVTVKLKPLINILWAGIVMLSAGIIPAMISGGFSVEELKRRKIKKIE